MKTKRTVAARSLVAAVAALAASGEAFAACSLSFSGLASPVSYPQGGGNYDPLSATDRAFTQSFTVTHSGSACNFFVGVNFGRSPTGSGAAQQRNLTIAGGASLNYNLFNNTTGLPLLDKGFTTSNGDVFAGAFTGNGAPQTFTYKIDVPASQFAGRGTHSDTVTFSAYDGTLTGSSTLVRTQNVVFNAPVAAVVQVSLTTTGAFASSASQTLDFGTLATGQVKSASLLARSNTPYNLTAVSSNGGALLLNPPISGDTSSVPYTMTLKGLSVDLSGAHAIFGAAEPATGVSGISPAYPINFTLGTVGRLTAGSYRDVVTITVTGQ